jgi:glycosyltransferase involved in cell wall biosynthesis
MKQEYVRRDVRMPTYSICICNYNMADTLERALVSVLEQLDDAYEVLVVDDGSNDGSVDILNSLCARFPTLRVLPLERDPKRKLGETRNISVREARGEYVILHVDTDDVWEPYIRDFVAVFHRIEACIGRDVLLSGQQINIGRRSFLMKFGPYRNTQRAQDRDMWLRLAGIDSYIPLEHRVFRHRLSRPKEIMFWKAIHDTWYHMLYDFRRGREASSYLKIALADLLENKSHTYSFKLRLARVFLVFPAYISSKFDDPLPLPENMRAPEAFRAYLERTRGTFAELMARLGGNGDLTFLSAGAREIFEYKGDGT